ncbi:glucose-1-phosphate adenylyltransferase subunit GlgD [Vagococcus acidifermentans]|uniref:Glucose-1-phosphate adenylyltransferase subunit GlgD n=1 Tax=Vagococcus acidifermentans TaxID=564710 RepID=A0A430B3D2_9ENTE|nr:glucose-1-phosphate adenylyltransferase subunit GlgD [Vagococcus acidifermentans]RSU14833.1 glucose-1-phosphate adenylyltransferase subunit GlgD [Vagococcus acidifermentans]
MRTNKLCAILSGIKKSEDLQPLTRKRPLATLPFDCKYRMIDFPLSSLVNASVNSIFMIFNQDETQSVFDHLGGGKEWNLDAIQHHYFIHLYQDFLKKKEQGKPYYETLIDYLRKSKSEYTVIMGNKVLCNIDLQAVLKIYQNQDSDMTVVYKRVPKEQITDTDSLISIGDDGVVNGAYFIDEAENGSKLHNLCMDIFMVRTNWLIDALKEGQEQGISANIHLFLQEKMTEMTCSAYEYTGYLGNVFDINSYYQVNMDMLNVNKFNSLLYTNKKIYTKLKNEVPTYYDTSSQVTNSHFATGCLIKGTVENSLLSRQTVVEEGAEVLDTITMANAYIGKNAKIRYAILDKNVTVEEGAEVIGTPEDIVVVEKGVTISKKS